MSNWALDVAVAGLAIACAAGVAACTDPGCIRNSECGDGFICKSAECVVESIDDAKRIGVEEDSGIPGKAR